MVSGSYPKQASHPPPTMPDPTSDPGCASLGCSSRYPNPSDACDRLLHLQRSAKDQHPTAEPVAPQGTGAIVLAKLGDDRTRGCVRAKRLSR